MAVQHRFHRGGAVPGVNRRGQHDAVRPLDIRRNVRHIVLLHAAVCTAHILAGIAPPARVDGLIGQRHIPYLRTLTLQFLYKRPAKFGRIAVPFWAAH